MGIKLYPKLLISGLVETRESAIKTVEEIKIGHIVTDEQAWESRVFFVVKNTKFKWRYEFIFYELTTLEEMKRDRKVVEDKH